MESSGEKLRREMENYRGRGSEFAGLESLSADSMTSGKEIDHGAMAIDSAIEYRLRRLGSKWFPKGWVVYEGGEVVGRLSGSLFKKDLRGEFYDDEVVVNITVEDGSQGSSKRLRIFLDMGNDHLVYRSTHWETSLSLRNEGLSLSMEGPRDLVTNDDGKKIAEVARVWKDRDLESGYLARVYGCKDPTRRDQMVALMMLFAQPFAVNP